MPFRPQVLAEFGLQFRAWTLTERQRNGMLDVGSFKAGIICLWNRTWGRLLRYQLPIEEAFFASKSQHAMPSPVAAVRVVMVGGMEIILDQDKGVADAQLIDSR